MKFPFLLFRTSILASLAAAAGCGAHVPPGSSLQAAIDNATPGQIITLQPGALYEGNFVLRKKAGAGYITIMTKNVDAAVPPGVRASPAAANFFAKIVAKNNGPAIATEKGAHHYKLIGIQILRMRCTASRAESLSRRVRYLYNPSGLDRSRSLGHDCCFGSSARPRAGPAVRAWRSHPGGQARDRSK